MLSVKKNRLISRNLLLDGLSEGPMNRGNPPIPGENCMKLSQNLPDRYSVAQLTQHGIKVKKMVQRWTVGTNGSSGIRKGQRRCTRQRRAKRFHSFGLQVSPARTSFMCHVRPLRLVVFFHYPILSEVVAALFTEQVPRLISLEDLPLGGIARILMCLLSFSF